MPKRLAKSQYSFFADALVLEDDQPVFVEQVLELCDLRRARRRGVDIVNAVTECALLRSHGSNPCLDQSPRSWVSLA